MSYTCPDCEDGVLETRVREVPLELKDDETARIVGGVVLVTSVGCNNGCSSESDEEEKPRQRKKGAPHRATQASGELCTKIADCDRPDGHTGRCNHKGKRAAE